MNKSKKIFVIIGCIATAIIVTATIVLGNTILSKNNKEPEAAPEAKVTPEVSQSPKPEETASPLSKEPPTAQEAVTTIEREYTYLNIDGLYFSPSWENYYFQDALEKYLVEVELADISVIEIVPQIETEDEIIYNFWVLLDSDVAMIKSTCNADTREYSFEIETDESIIREYIDLNTPDGIDDPTISYADELIFSNLEVLKDVLPDNAYNRYESELASFLDSEREMRSYYTISDVKSSSGLITFMCNFDKLRDDGKNISVSYSTETDSFRFLLV